MIGCNIMDAGNYTKNTWLPIVVEVDGRLLVQYNCGDYILVNFRLQSETCCTYRKNLEHLLWTYTMSLEKFVHYTFQVYTPYTAIPT